MAMKSLIHKTLHFSPRLEQTPEKSEYANADVIIYAK